METFFNPLEDYQTFLENLKRGGAIDDCLPIPPILIETLVEFLAAPLSLNEEDKYDLKDFISKVVKKTHSSCSAVILTFYYLQIFNIRTSFEHSLSYSGKAEFLAAIIIADKYLFDQALANTVWARIARIYSIEQVNAYEREFLRLMNYEIVVNENQYEEFVFELSEQLYFSFREAQVIANKQFLKIETGVVVSSPEGSPIFNTPQTLSDTELAKCAVSLSETNIELSLNQDFLISFDSPKQLFLEKEQKEAEILTNDNKEEEQEEQKQKIQKIQEEQEEQKQQEKPEEQKEQEKQEEQKEQKFTFSPSLPIPIPILSAALFAFQSFALSWVAYKVIISNFILNYPLSEKLPIFPKTSRHSANILTRRLSSCEDLLSPKYSNFTER